MLTRILSLLRQVEHKQRLSRLELKSKGKNVQIEIRFHFHCAQNISIGDNVYIGPDSWINAIGGVSIGSGTIIGPRLTIFTANHRYNGANAIPYDDVILLRRVELAENIWIGGSVIIVPGVTIGEGCIVGAGSVVTKDFPAFHVLGGNPAQTIGYRNEDDYRELKRKELIYLSLKNKGLMQPHIGTDTE
jgi:acetyltransferase-like isoleucine patch superfamily enzyme